MAESRKPRVPMSEQIKLLQARFITGSADAAKMLPDRSRSRVTDIPVRQNPGRMLYQSRSSPIRTRKQLMLHSGL